MALLQSTTISGSNANTGSLSITGSTMVFPIIESSLTGSFSGSGKMWVNADGQNLQYSLNTTLGTIQSPASFMGAWSAGGNMIKGRATKAGAGTQNAALAAGGYDAPATLTCVEEYDGTSWSAQNALITSRHRFGGAGLQNAAVVAGGVGCNQTEEYDGSSWSAGGNLITIQYSQAFAGDQTAAISAFGGTPGVATTSQLYNGSSWATTNSGNTARNDTSGMGTANSALAMGGNTGGAVSACSELWNGTTWSTWVPILTARSYLSATGTTNAGLNFFGGNPSTVPNMKCVEEWNGISFVHGCTALQDRKGRMGVGSQSAALAAGGYDGSDGSPLTEEYTKDFITPYTTCVWTSGGGMITPRSQGAGGGTNNAALVAGGGTPTRVSCTEEWDGNQWSAGGALSITRSALAGGGTQNAGWVAGGEPAGGTATEEYNGTSWASGGTLAIGGYGKRGGGPQTAAQVITGTPNPRVTNQTYDGTTWTSATSMPAARSAAALTGTCAASIVDGGSPYTTTAILWNGSSWSETGTKTTCTSGNQMGGTQNDALSFGGYNPANPNSIVSTEHYDGSSWSVQGNLSVASKYGAGAATSPAGAVDSFYAGGYNTAVIGNMQLYNAVCSATLCSSLPVWSGAAQLLAGADYGAGFGTQNSAVLATGRTTPAPTAYFGSQEYNGSAWSTGGTTNCQTGEGYGRAGAGTQNAGLLFGGWPAQTWTEKYDGSAWTTANAMITTAFGRGSSGTQNAALAAGKGPNPSTTATEEFDGTNWSSGGSLSTARYGGLSAGTQNDTVYAGGTLAPTLYSCTEEYNGTSWASGGALNIARQDQSGFQMFGEGAYSAVTMGGRTPTKLANTEEYDGATWSHRPNIPKATSSTTRVGTSNAGLMAGGRTNATSVIPNVYEYNNNTNTCVGAWSIGGSMNCARRNFGSNGTQNAASAFGGNGGSTTTTTEEYDGSSWTVGGSMINGRLYLAGAGTQNAGLAFGGNDPDNQCVTEEYNGSSWSQGGILITGRDLLAGAGTQNEALAFGGRSPYTASTERYDGVAWSNTTKMNLARISLGGAGTQSEALAFGGSIPALTGMTEEYNCTFKQALGAGLQNWIGKVNFVTE